MITMQKSFPGIQDSISDWKGQDITNFQEELLSKVNANLSEKWFYNHMKSENKSLPRIDVLNFLSKYVGYKNWDDFVFHHKDQELIKTETKSISKGNKYFIFIPLITVLFMAGLYLIFQLISHREVIYQFSFYDTYTKEIIRSEKNELILLCEEESPLHYLGDSLGTIFIETNKDVVTLVARSPYYKPDTIHRILRKLEPAYKISLQVDDYALILHYFSTLNTDDWQKRRSYLEELIDESALFYQVISSQGKRGMLLYNKTEFIDKLTMPTGSLKHIEILETRFRDDKIALLRFRINQPKK